MKSLLVLVASLTLFSAAVYVTAVPVTYNIPESGVCVIEFNASFNAGNSVDWLDNLSDCKGRRIDIAANPDMQKEHKIVVVPTLVIFSEGEEVERFQANIMMQLEATQNEVQEAVDEIIMSAF
tara:strand:- start:1003 stop:1371 length:369 start_codon:yes stop_codon:yes gene_type:complete